MTLGRPSRAARSGPSPTNASLAPSSCEQRLCEADDVLPLVERADAQISGAVAVPAERGARLGLVAAAKALEVDTAVDHLHLAERARDARLELAAQVVRDGDHAVRAADDGFGGRLHAANRADIADVAAVGGDDERGARREVGDEAGGDEVVGVNDVRLRAAGDGAGFAEELQVLGASPSAAGQDGQVELVAAAPESVDERDEKRAVVGIVRPRPHLRDEEDPHAREL